MSPLIVPSGSERCLSKYQVTGFQVLGREETSTTVRSTSFHFGITEIVCSIDSWMLTGDIVLDGSDTIGTRSLLR